MATLSGKVYSEPLAGSMVPLNATNILQDDEDASNDSGLTEKLLSPRYVDRPPLRPTRSESSVERRDHRGPLSKGTRLN